ncbi:SDR family oxidoreductase [Luteimonas sp. 100069]|uniref:SDR family oxidoreductase n=1 Tax=Luteimonas sp. 100069 TaxID=2006109 RepID=UPI000F510C3E|nr:SDR family oxidoreductase [Luteimonas sp. 100069]RPD88511.1 SDR family oxidoreductase [Luteimonas sp. 100069]
MSLLPPIEPCDPAPLRDRVVLVTGGAQGIGRGIAQAVLGAGGRLVIGDLDRDAGRACLSEWAVGERARFLPLDVAREPSVRGFVARALIAFGRIDGLVNNAGPASPEIATLSELPLADWRRFIDGHLTGTFLCSKHALPELRKAGGAIINIASSRVLQSEPHTEAYAAAKGGIVAFTHALAVSEGPDVRVNAISPGWIATEGWRKPTARRAPKLSRRDHAQHPAGRVGQPPDIGALAVFLLSDAAGFITGQNIVVDGGMTRKMQYV